MYAKSKSFHKIKNHINLISLLGVSLCCHTNVFAEHGHKSYPPPKKNYCITPYVGLSGQLDRLHFEERFGAPLYNRKLASGGVIAGLNFTDYFGVEFEFQLAQRSAKTNTVVEGQFLPEAGRPLKQGQFEVYRTRIGVDTTSLSMVSFLPLDFFGINNISIYGSFGGAFLKVKACHAIFWDELVPIAGPISPEAFLRVSYSFKSSNRKLIPIIKIGLDNQIAENINMRLFVNWRDTAGFDVRSRGLLRSVGHLKFKSLVGIGAAFIYSF